MPRSAAVNLDFVEVEIVAVGQLSADESGGAAIERDTEGLTVVAAEDGAIMAIDVLPVHAMLGQQHLCVPGALRAAIEAVEERDFREGVGLGYSFSMAVHA
jgi:hypothetical protein